MKLSRVGVDLAKNVYQLHGVDRHGKTVWKRRLRRGQWLPFGAAIKLVGKRLFLYRISASSCCTSRPASR